jgi:S1-C subfamily serine protease
MERIVLRHLSGSKANQVEEFPLNHFRELVAGRDPSATVKYDPDRDDLVGRQHAKIVQDPADPTQFTITDLNSRNGTFLNKQRIAGSAKIFPGDHIQFGPGGPEFVFDIEPRPANMVRPTRVGGTDSTTATMGSGVPAVPPTRTGAAPTPLPMTAVASPMGNQVGKATVERMIAQGKTQSRNYLLLGGGLVVLLIIAVAGGLYVKSKWDQGELAKQGAATSEELKRLGDRTAAMTPAEIAAACSDATVFVQVSWTLIATSSGNPLFHQYIQNAYRARDGKVYSIVADGRPFVAAYKLVRTGNGNIVEPYLTSSTEGPRIPIGRSHSGSGFCVTSDGFIITNRHVAAAWQNNYAQVWDGVRQYAFPGVLVADNGVPYLGQDGQPMLVDFNSVATWVPGASKQFGESQLGRPAVEGRNDSLYVTFQKTELRIPAKIARVSDRHDVAMVKIDLPEPVRKVDLFDNYDTIKPGDAAVVLGYPGGSPPEIGIIRSKAAEYFAPSAQFGVIPNPTLSVGYTSRILRTQESPGKDPIISMMGDIYQLTINTTGGGNSGGPVFDDRGRAIAIYTYGLGSDFQASGAVPIRFAKELMGITPVR